MKWSRLVVERSSFHKIDCVTPISSLARRAARLRHHPTLVPLLLLCIVCLLSSQSFAQGAHHPFAVGANEGAAAGTQGLSGWILSQESGFYRLLSGAIRAAKQSGAAGWGLIGLSFAYGIFHAAGPGHGKAVIASYMLANERALRRGLVIAFGAALLQGLSAIAIVGLSAIVFKATAARMTSAANIVEIISYAGIVLLGVVLVYTKGRALILAWRMAPAPLALAANGGPRMFIADDCTLDHVHGFGCGHVHAPDPRLLDKGFSWKGALLTMVAAGARPCSGAILVLVFALAQNIFSAGLFAVLAMSLGTAMTTSALASLAVFAKFAAVKYSKADSHWALLAGRIFEVGAAVCVLALGLILLLATIAGRGPAN
ncbi:high frequency lysogenization protein HflD [Beijerinckiaceae bacterium]|nr:high frequency lysogenization protein HflD [Beijerinckiaceae bacterium]